VATILVIFLRINLPNVEDSFIIGKKNKLPLTKSGGLKNTESLGLKKVGGSSLGALLKFTPIRQTQQSHSMFHTSSLVPDVVIRERITPVSRQLHWLPVRQRIEFNLAVLVY